MADIGRLQQNFTITLKAVTSDFAGSRLSFLTPESPERSFSGKNQLFKLAVNRRWSNQLFQRLYSNGWVRKPRQYVGFFCQVIFNLRHLSGFASQSGLQ
jgi:hypothetical protein